MTRSQSGHERENDGIGVQELYKRLFCDPNLVGTFKNILICVEIVLCIPMSSAICEGGFSAIARIKSDWRASLNEDMLNCLRAISITGLDPKDFNAR